MRTLKQLRGAVRQLMKVRQAQTVLAAADVASKTVERVQDLMAGARDRASRLRSGIQSRPRPVPRQETVSRRLHAPHSPPVDPGRGCSASTQASSRPHI
jgi:hypothetical protein